MTKAIFATLIGGLLAFTAGIVTAGSWPKYTCQTVTVPPAKPDIPIEPPSPQQPSPHPAITPKPDASELEVVFKNGRLKLVAEQIQLKSERLCYDIDVRYPQIVGSDAPYIIHLNQRIRRVAVDHYRWALNPPKEHLLNKKAYPEPYNFVELDYQILLANDSFISIAFYSCDSAIGAAHSAIRSSVINYDLKSHREIKLNDLFKPNSKYLEFIARSCTDELKPLEPVKAEASMFTSWNFTSDGILFNFDPCTVSGCSSPPQEVTIPYSKLKPFLKRNLPVGP